MDGKSLFAMFFNFLKNNDIRVEVDMERTTALTAQLHTEADRNASVDLTFCLIF
jgi:hypothetical protein